jgi:hypothetical protein
MQCGPANQRATPDGHNDGTHVSTCAHEPPARYGAARVSSEDERAHLRAAAAAMSRTLKPPTPHPTRALSIGWAASWPDSTRLRPPEMLPRSLGAQ